jgi:hypothetical protein
VRFPLKDTVGMRVALLCSIFLLTPHFIGKAQTQTPVNFETCNKRVELIVGLPPISKLSPTDAEHILAALSKDLTSWRNVTGWYLEIPAGTSEHDYLLQAMTYAPIPGGKPGERLMLIRFENGCGAHGNCATWIMSLTGENARSMVPWSKEGSSSSASSAWGMLVEPRMDSSYPDIALLAHISGSETAVATYREKNGMYSGGSGSACAEVLQHPE